MRQRSAEAGPDPDLSRVSAVQRSAEAGPPPDLSRVSAVRRRSAEAGPPSGDGPEAPPAVAPASAAPAAGRAGVQPHRHRHRHTGPDVRHQPAQVRSTSSLGHLASPTVSLEMTGGV